MGEHKSFGSKKQKLRTIWETNQENINKIKDLNLTKIRINTDSTNKVIGIKPLADNIDITDSTYTDTFLLTNLTDDAIRSMTVVGIFSTSEGFVNEPNYIQIPNVGAGSFSDRRGVVYVLLEKDDNTYDLYLRVSLKTRTEEDPFVLAPMFIDVNIYFQNYQVFEDV